MQIVIDRFEGDFAVVELPDGTNINVLRKLFDGFCEGDRVIIEKAQNDNSCDIEDIFED